MSHHVARGESIRRRTTIVVETNCSAGEFATVGAGGQDQRDPLMDTRGSMGAGVSKALYFVERGRRLDREWRLGTGAVEVACPRLRGRARRSTGITPVSSMRM